MTDITRRGFLGAAGALAGASALGVPAGREKARATAITLAITEYLRYTPLLWGAIPAWTGEETTEGIQLRFVRGTRREMLDRTLEDPSVDGGESSMLGHLLRVAQGDRSMVAVPVFPLRNFTARDLYTLRGTALDPRALDGRRLGIYNWAASGAVWYRRLLRYLGNDPASIQWVVGTADAPGLVTSRAPLPAHVRNAPAEKSLTDLVREGVIDAFFAPLPPAAYHRDNGPLARLIPDFPAFEKGYYADTGFYPPQHVLVVRRETWDRDPGIGEQLLQAFQECEIGFTAAQRLYPYESPWMMREVEDTELLMGLDYHHHGLEKNLAAMEAFLEGAFLDGLTDHRVAVEEYFREFLQG